jgi:hypothetical protein
MTVNAAPKPCSLIIGASIRLRIKVARLRPAVSLDGQKRPLSQSFDGPIRSSACYDACVAVSSPMGKNPIKEYGQKSHQGVVTGVGDVIIAVVAAVGFGVWNRIRLP